MSERVETAEEAAKELLQTTDIRVAYWTLHRRSTLMELRLRELEAALARSEKAHLQYKGRVGGLVNRLALASRSVLLRALEAILAEEPPHDHNDPACVWCAARSIAAAVALGASDGTEADGEGHDRR